jgi:hypothetical protein
MVALALGGVTIASCTQQSASPTSPTGLSASGAVQPAAEYWVTLFDETPAPSDETPAAPAPPPPPPPPPGSAPSPWPPGPPPLAQPGIPMPTPPSTHTRLHIKINPEPVTHSGVAVPTFGCRDHRYTWYYDQHLISDTGVKVIFTERDNFFDGRFSSKNGSTIELPGNREVILHTRWCSSYPKPHYTQTRFKGRDEYNEPVEISGPWVRLLTP